MFEVLDLYLSYPSGRPAITISSIEHGLFYYIAQKDTDEDPNPLLVVFEPNGYGTTYYTSGNIRYVNSAE